MNWIIYFILLFGQCCCENIIIVKTTNYKIFGKEIKETSSSRKYGVFLGVPYAKPPQGKLRFQVGFQIFKYNV